MQRKIAVRLTESEAEIVTRALTLYRGTMTSLIASRPKNRANCVGAGTAGAATIECWLLRRDIATAVANRIGAVK